MKIQFIELSESLRIGGLEKAARDMATYLMEKGHTVIRDTLEIDWDNPPDLVHFHGLWSLDHSRLCKKCLEKKVPYVISPHGMLEPWAFRHKKWKKLPYFHLIEKKRISKSSYIIATAEEERKNIRLRLPDARIEVLSLGIENTIKPDYAKARESLGWSEHETVLIYLSRIHPKKGLLELLLALDNIATAKQLPENIRLVILGDGPKDYFEECNVVGQKLQKHCKIEWYLPKWGDGKWPYLQGADLFCLPTYSENFGLVILEAGIVGTPILTTTGTPWKHIEEAGFGWVKEPGQASCEAMLKSFFQSDKRFSLQKRDEFAAWTDQHYAWPRIIERYETFYRKVIQENREQR